MPFLDGKEIPPTSLFDIDIDATSKVLTVPQFYQTKSDLNLNDCPVLQMLP